MKKTLKELSESGDDECFAELLSKHRNLDKTLRIMAYIMGWFPTFRTSSFPDKLLAARTLFERQTLRKTAKALVNMKLNDVLHLEGSRIML